MLVAKIARFDYPKEWPELFPTLIQAIESSDSLVQHRSLLMMHHVVKAISSKRLAGKCRNHFGRDCFAINCSAVLGDRRIFQDFTSNIYPFVLNLWNNYTEAFLRDIVQNSSTEQTTANLEKALLLLRILRKLTVYGFNKPYLNQNCMCFLKIVFERARTTLECRKSPSTLHRRNL